MYKNKSLVPVFIFFSAFLSCGDKIGVGSSGMEKTADESVLAEQKNIELVKKMFNAFNEHNWEGMTDYYSKDALYLDPSYGKNAVTQQKQDIIKKYEELSLYIPNIKDSLTNVFASGNKVLIEFISTGTTSDKKRFDLPICAVFLIKDSLIIIDHTYYNEK